MIVCRPAAAPSNLSLSSHESESRPGGPVFVPRRRPSVFAETLLADLEGSADEAVTPYDELWFSGRPAV